MSCFSLSNGEKLYYEDTGKGDRTIIMMHGWTSTHDVFAPCVLEIAKEARCITYDHRGHGNSKDANHDYVTMDTLADDLNELITGLDLHNIILLGWSMGAGVALNYMSVYGCDAISSVILCDMTPKQLNDETWKLGLYQGAYTKKDFERDSKKKFYPVYKSFVVNAIPRLKKVPGFLLKKPLMKTLSMCDEKTLITLSASMNEKDYRESVKQISVPVCYFYAVPGSLFSPALADWYRDNVQTAYEAVAFEDSTHMLVTDHPDRFAKEVVRVLKK